MKGKVKAVEKSHASSVEISEPSDTSNDNESVDGTFDEGKADRKPAAAESAVLPKAYVPACPTPVRIVVGVFSTVVAVGGCAMGVIGGNALYYPPDPDPSLHRGLLGGGLALLVTGAAGIVSAFFQREQTQPAAAQS